MTERTRYGREIAAALTLLRTGRVFMAVRVLQGLTQLVTAEMLEAMARAYEDGRRDLAREITGEARQKRPKKPTNAEWLRARIADPALRVRAKVTLRLDDQLLDTVAEGGVQLSSWQWKRLREVLAR